MTEPIRPFHRLDYGNGGIESRWLRRAVSLMRRNFWLVGLVLFAAGLGGMVYLYNLYLYRLDLDWGLRINLLEDAYEPGAQLQAAVTVAALFASLLFFWAAGSVRQGRVRAVGLTRAAAAALLVTLPAALIVWELAIDVPGLSFDTMRWVVRVLSGVLVLQGVLAVVYLAISLLPGYRFSAETKEQASLPVLRRIRIIGMGAWVLVIVGVGIGLAWATDWIERPVAVPEPGEPLYATTFDDYLDEWDTYDGVDSAQVVELSSLLDDSHAGETRPMEGAVMRLVHGSPYQGEIVWSNLARKYGAFDLTVDARLMTGQPEAAQYGVIFRHRDEQNFYMFRLSADGYYSLAKVTDGVEERISEWGTFDAIQQGNAVNNIRVVGLQDAFRFYVNGVPVPLCMRGENLTSMWAGDECFTDRLRYIYYDHAFEQGGVALAVGTFDGTEVAVAFDNVVIVGPDTALEPELEEGLE